MDEDTPLEDLICYQERWQTRLGLQLHPKWFCHLSPPWVKRSRSWQSYFHYCLQRTLCGLPKTDEIESRPKICWRFQNNYGKLFFTCWAKIQPSWEWQLECMEHTPWKKRWTYTLQQQQKVTYTFKKINLEHTSGRKVWFTISMFFSVWWHECTWMRKYPVCLCRRNTTRNTEKVPTDNDVD